MANHPRAGLAVLATFVVAGAASAGVNLVFNGGFEQGFAGWSVPPNMPPGPNGANFQTPTDNPHSGLRYAQLSSFQLQYVSQFLPDTVAGTDYELEFWARRPGSLLAQTMVVRWEGQGVYFPQIGGAAHHDWTLFSVNLTANSNGSFLEFGQAVFPGEMHIDSIVVRPVPGPATLPLMTIGSLVAFRRQRR